DARRATLTLHSYPTRRSSDLHRIHLWLHYTGKADRLARGFGGADPERNCCDPLGKEDKALVPLRRRRCGNNRSFSIWERKGGSSDRKSTRLNSSHVKISYAVF